MAGHVSLPMGDEDHQRLCWIWMGSRNHEASEVGGAVLGVRAFVDAVVRCYRTLVR